MLKIRLSKRRGARASWVPDTPQREIGKDICASVRNSLHDMTCLMIHARFAVSYKSGWDRLNSFLTSPFSTLHNLDGKHPV